MNNVWNYYQRLASSAFHSSQQIQIQNHACPEVIVLSYLEKVFLVSQLSLFKLLRNGIPFQQQSETSTHEVYLALI